ncbi:hypothetical protein FRB96_002550 [Tulasnella sp. 330]|nr:hypothetical protein FRB96_002550 [Tulasnella sp. 330]
MTHNTPYYPGWTMPPTTPSRHHGNMQWNASPQPMYWPGAAAVDPNQARRQAWMAVHQGAEKAAKEAAEQEEKEKAEEKKKKKEQDAMHAFWAAPSPKAGCSAEKSPGVVNVNIENLQHGVFGQPPQPTGQSTTTQPSPTGSTSDATPFVPSMSCYTGSPYPMATPYPAATPYTMAPSVNWTSRPMYAPQAPSSPPRRSAFSPWSSSRTGPGKEVIDVASLVASHRTVDIQINPIVASRFGAPNLHADVREPIECVSVASTDKDGQIELKEWKGQSEPLTLPMLNTVMVISALFQEPLVVSNPTGVTVGDFVTHLLNWSQSPIPSATLSALPASHQTYIEHHGHSLRAPFHPNSIVGPHISWIDLLFGRTVFKGLKRDGPSTREVIGWDHPACFVVELSKPESSNAGSPMMGMSATPMGVGMPMMMGMGIMTPMGMMMPQMGMGGWM